MIIWLKLLTELKGEGWAERGVRVPVARRDWKRRRTQLPHARPIVPAQKLQVVGRRGSHTNETLTGDRNFCIAFHFMAHSRKEEKGE